MSTLSELLGQCFEMATEGLHADSCMVVIGGTLVDHGSGLSQSISVVNLTFSFREQES